MPAPSPRPRSLIPAALALTAWLLGPAPLGAQAPTAPAAPTVLSTPAAPPAESPATSPAAAEALPTPRLSLTENTLDYRFAESIRFALDAALDRPVEDVVLRYFVGAEDDAPVNRRLPEYEPGTRVRAEHADDLVRGQIPPAAPITWWWELRGADGATVETPRETEIYLDGSFDWQSLQEGEVEVWWYEGDRAFAEDLAARTTAALEALEARVGSRPERPIRIVAYANQQDLRPALFDRGGAYEARLATLGARVAPDIIVLDTGTRGEDVYEVLAHELAHIVLNLHFEEEYVDAPLWLDEGLAMYAEGPLAPEEQATLDRAIREDAIMSVRSLTSFPGDAGLVPLAYAQSRDLVAFLIESGGEPKFQAFLDSLGSAERTPDEALQEVYGYDQLGLYQAYRAARSLAPAATPAPGTALPARRQEAPEPSNAGLCGSAALLLPALVIVWRRRRGEARPPGA